MIEYLGASGQLVLSYARRIAADLRHETLDLAHVVLGLGELGDEGINAALDRVGLDLTWWCEQIKQELGEGSGPGKGPFPLSGELKRALAEAELDAAALGGKYVEAPHLLLGVLEVADGKGGTDALLERSLDRVGVSPSEVHRAVVDMIERAETTPSEFYKTRRNVEQAGLGKSSKLLDSLGRDLTRAAAQGALTPIIGRDDEIDELVRVLLGMRKNNAVLVGDPGVGKTAIVEGLAQRIVAGQIPGFENMRIRTIEMGALVAGTKYRGQFEKRLKSLIDAVSGRDDMILFIDELHMIIGAGAASGGKATSAANMLKPVLTDGTLKVIGATTLDEYRTDIESDKALARRFRQIYVGEPTRDETIGILTGLRTKYEAFHVVTITDEAIAAAVDLSIRHLPDRFLPDKALDLLDGACTETKLSARASDVTGGAVDTVVDANDIASLLSMMLEIPIAALTADEAERLVGMADALKERILGKDDAVDVVCNAIIRARTGFGRHDRPLGVFLFAGPTGVGKTTFAEELAKFLFGDLDHLIEVDMSQFVSPESASELRGPPAGVSGWERGGRLANAVKARPHSVVVFDDIDKAHPAVWNVLLPILDDGAMTDTLDRTIDFSNTVIILTTNLGSKHALGRGVGFVTADPSETSDDLERDVRADLEDVLGTELVNRADEVLVFRPLDRPLIGRIVEHQLAEITPVQIDATPAAIELLTEESYHPALGARPVQRTIQRLVTNPLSLMLAHGELAEGDVVRVDVVNGALTFDQHDTNR